ncbi:glucosaminidase domain-containing protein [Actinocorallia aurea]
MTVDKSYFVVGDQVQVFDFAANAVTGQSALTSQWSGLTGEFSSGLDAALDLGTSQLFVFRGGEYARIPFGTQAVDDGYPLPIAGHWPGVAFPSVDAAMNWGDGKAYLFSGPQYARYDIAADAQDPGYPKDIVGNWGGVSAVWVGDGIDAAINPGSGRAYFFKGEEYIALDWATKSQLPGYPIKVSEEWPGLTGPFAAAWTNAAPAPRTGAASATAAGFVAKYRGYAEHSQEATGVPALVTLGQAALESNWGSAAEGHNFFGIKAKATDPPEKRQLWKTREVLPTPNATGFPEVLSVTQRPDGMYEYVVRAWFRKYDSPEEAFSDHGRFLRNQSRYAAAFDHLDDPYAFAREVAKAGYATDPHYYDVLAKRMAEIEANL